MKSMTGYGRQTWEGENKHIIVEIRSVNSRYFSLNSRLSSPLLPYENEIKKIVNEYISRGTISLFIQYNDESKIPEASINNNLIQDYYKKIQKLELPISLLETLQLNTLLNLPGVLETEAEEILDECSWGQVREILKQALAQIEQMMKQEGEHLKIEILEYCKEIEQNIQSIEKLAPRISEEFHQKLRSRMLNLASQEHFSFKEEDILKEVAIFSEKADITEEIVRFKSHLNQLNKILLQNGPIAKTVDFILQEMVREITTMSNKSNNAECSQLVVSLKSSIEKIREQIQNVE